MYDSLAPTLLYMSQEPSIAPAALLLWKLQQLKIWLCIKWTVWKPTGLNHRDFLYLLKVLRMLNKKTKDQQGQGSPCLNRSLNLVYSSVFFWWSFLKGCSWKDLHLKNAFSWIKTKQPNKTMAWYCLTSYNIC